MSGHRSFLTIGGGGADILSLKSSGYEILHCDLAFQQGIDQSGKAITRTHGGTISITLNQMPPDKVIEWAIDSRKYNDGTIVLLDDENAPMEKIEFTHAACVDFEVDYTLEGTDYALTRIKIMAEKISIGGVELDNEWIK